VIVIGKDAKNVPKEKAMEYIFGYTVADDVSARSVEHVHCFFLA
jgi:2-keto-4-pentenoate hydratase/2-oxohepta-3-ene-1,7-dioic acid hydratase in catechol pathway